MPLVLVVQCAQIEIYSILQRPQHDAYPYLHIVNRAIRNIWSILSTCVLQHLESKVRMCADWSLTSPQQYCMVGFIAEREGSREKMDSCQRGGSWGKRESQQRGGGGGVHGRREIHSREGTHGRREIHSR